MTQEDSPNDQPSTRSPAGDALSALDARIAACFTCRDRLKLGIDKPQNMDRGGRRARILGIGEAPGRVAATEGMAFAGRSFGNLLKHFRAAGFAGTESELRDGIYLTSILKCVPADDSEATFRAMSVQCLPFLWEQLAAVGPRFVLVFGAKVFDALDLRGDFASSVGGLYRTPEIFDLFPPTAPDVRWLVMPHPSPASRVWNNADVTRRVQNALRVCLNDVGLLPERNS